MSLRRKTLLLIDDDEIFGDTVIEYLGSPDLEVLHSTSAATGLQLCARRRIDAVLLDQRLPDAEGYMLCPDILRHNPETKIIFITALPSFENAVRAIKSGAFDYLPKPMELDHLSLTVRRALKTLDLERVAELHEYEHEKTRTGIQLVGLGGGLAGLELQIRKASDVEAPVLVTGETGTGKNMVARAIHYRRINGDRPFVSVNCAALSENLIEAELFGYEKGAFTGALAARKGIFEMAEGGTLLLDEIGEMSLNLQAKLLGVLDDKTIRRLGSEVFRQVQVRIIAATSVDLENAIARRTFREDLYYRIGVIRIKVPPLRDRKEDLPELCRHILGQITGGREVNLTEGEIERLIQYPWPGNVRELKNILERAVILAREGHIFPSELLASPGGVRKDTAMPDPPPHSEGVLPMEEVERRHIAFALRQFSGNLARTARALGISLSTIKRKSREYGLS